MIYEVSLIIYTARPGITFINETCSNFCTENSTQIKIKFNTAYTILQQKKNVGRRTNDMKWRGPKRKVLI